MLLMDDDDGAGGARVNLNSSAYDVIDVVTIKEQNWPILFDSCHVKLAAF